jgi:23S rRNA (pseudouridine1915-N3)-methyltransferase
VPFHLHVLAVGRLRRGPFQDLAAVYADRVRLPLTVRDIEARPGLTDLARTAAEGLLLLEALPAGALCIALDGQGRNISSPDLAALVRTAQQDACPLAFLIGGAEGLSPAVRARASQTLAFGQATWPHQLVRIMLLEQLYRAETILAGHPYHREG